MAGPRATKGIESITDKQIVLDTSVLLLLADKGYRPQIVSVLKKLIRQGNGLFLSEVSVFEINKGTTTNAKFAEWARLLRRFTPIKIDQQVMMGAGILFGIMKGSSATFKSKENDMACDLLIGSTVVGNNTALLMSTNIIDFHLPCWDVVAEGRVVKKHFKSNGWHLDNWYLFKFNYKQMPSDFRPSVVALP